MSTSEEAPKDFKLSKECELRFEVEHGWIGRVQVTKGTAELFGVPCLLNEQYDLGIGKYAVFTWYGCDITLQGIPAIAKPSGSSPLSSAYVMDSHSTTTMIAAVNVHGRLEQEREDAGAKNTRGPVTIIVGPTDSGKSTLARILCSYAARRGKRPIFVDLDPGQNQIGPPGIVAATVVDVDSISVEEGISPSAALVYFYGYASPEDSPDGYRKNVEKLAATIESRFSLDPGSKSSGCIVNTCGWIDGEGYNLLLHAIQTFKADVILVIGQDLLLSRLKRDVPTTCNVVKLPVSGGASARNKEYRKRGRDRKIREYFNGSSVGGNSLTPSIQEVSFDDITILRVPNKSDVADDAMRPVGKTNSLDPNRPRPVELTPMIQHSLLAVSYAQDESELLTKNVAGFVHIQNVDPEARKITLLSPQKGQLPSNYLLMGGIKWIDKTE